jgi:hypothetical protein
MPLTACAVRGIIQVGVSPNFNCQASRKRGLMLLQDVTFDSGLLDAHSHGSSHDFSTAPLACAD